MLETQELEEEGETQLDLEEATQKDDFISNPKSMLDLQANISDKESESYLGHGKRKKKNPSYWKDFI